MIDSLDELLCERYPLLFSKRKLSTRQSPMARGFSCGEGWFDLIDTLCAELQALTEKGKAPQLVAEQVKEKLGELRFYVGTAVAAESVSPEQQAVIRFAKSLSARVCEVCGAPGRRGVSGAWFRARCLAHESHRMNAATTRVLLYATPDPDRRGNEVGDMRGVLVLPTSEQRAVRAPTLAALAADARGGTEDLLLLVQVRADELRERIQNFVILCRRAQAIDALKACAPRAAAGGLTYVFVPAEESFDEAAQRVLAGEPDALLVFVVEEGDAAPGAAVLRSSILRPPPCARHFSYEDAMQSDLTRVEYTNVFTDALFDARLK